MKKKLLIGKKVTVMGLGLHGGGVAVVKWLVKHGAIVTVTDLKTKLELKLSVGKLKGLKVKYVLGKHEISDFKNVDLVVQNPGVPKESKYIKIAENSGVQLENEASLFFKYCPAKIIGITGTRGKSTTSALIYEILKTGRKKVWLAGLPQKPMLAPLDQINGDDFVILELSSWQLEILGKQKQSPHISIITNIFPDHLNRYFGMTEYITAKKNIFIYQDPNDVSVLNLDNKETRKLGKEVSAQRFWFSKKYFKEQNGCYVKGKNIFFRQNGQELKLASLQACKLTGEHNLENVLAALTVAGILNISASKIEKTLSKFLGLPGRLELIRNIGGVDYINDTTSTMPDATIAALNQFKNKKVILVAGGDSKNIPDVKYQKLAKLIKQKCKAVILFSGEGSDQLIESLKKIKYKPLIYKVFVMTEAISLAQNFTRQGDIVLLSPACASFGLFTHEFDRGEQFNQVVNKGY